MHNWVAAEVGKLERRKQLIREPQCSHHEKKRSRLGSLRKGCR